VVPDARNREEDWNVWGEESRPSSLFQPSRMIDRSWANQSGVLRVAPISKHLEEIAW